MKKKEQEIVRKDFIDGSGTPRAVLIPDGETDYAIGIPVSLDIGSLYPHMPEQFTRDLTIALHAQGLVEAADYFQPGADQRFKAAMLSIIKADFLSLQTLAKQEMNHA